MPSRARRQFSEKAGKWKQENMAESQRGALGGGLLLQLEFGAKEFEVIEGELSGESEALFGGGEKGL